MLETNPIENILTLRYNPNSTSSLKKLFWQEFKDKSAENETKNVESMLKNSIVKFVETRNIKKTSLALSGGIDSMLILELFRETCPDVEITCISAGFNEDDIEVKQAETLANRFNCDFHPIILENFLNNLPMQINIIKEPKWHYYWFFLANTAKKFSNSLLSGDGGDELFGGYVFRYKKFLTTINDSNNWKKKVESYLSCHNRDWVDDQTLLFGSAIKFSWEKIHNNFKQFFDNSLEPLDQVFLADYNGKLMYDWVPALEKIHSYFQLTGYAPILDEKIINFSSHIHSKNKYDSVKNQGKLILREILRQKDLKIFEGKRGFSPDLFGYWENFGNEIIHHYLLDARVVEAGLIKKNWILNAIDRVKDQNDIRYINKLLSVLSLEIWYRLFFSKEIKPHDKLL